MGLLDAFRAAPRTDRRQTKEHTAGTAITALSATGRSVPPTRGTVELLKAYSELPWLRALVSTVSFSVAQVEWVVSRRTSSGDLEPIEQHDAIGVLEAGNPMLTGLAGRQVTQQHLELAGEGFWIQELNGRGLPIELWPIPPQRVTSTPTPGSERRFKIRNATGIEHTYPAEAIVWFVDPNPLDPYGRGSGTARALGDELDTDELAAKYLKAWFHNGARPDLVAVIEGANAEQIKATEEQWLAKFQGFWKTRRPLFMNRKVEFKELYASFQEQQMVELRKFERDIAVGTFGIPPEILGIVENSNRATIWASDFIFQTRVVVPRLERFRASLQRDFLSRWGDERLVIDYVSPVTEDQDFKLKVMRSAAWAFTLDEWRAQAEHDELPDGGDERLGPLNLIPLGGGGFGTATERSAKAVTKDEPEQAERIKRVIEAIEAVTLSEAMEPHFADLVDTFGQAAVDEIGVGIDFELADPRVDDFLKRRAGERIVQINETTQRRVRRQLVDGVSDGEGIEKLAKRIEGVFDDAIGRRSRVIARTETTRASSFGAQEGIRQAGVDEKQWLAVRDDRTRGTDPVDAANHTESGLDGMHVPVDDNFTSPATGASGPGPGEMGMAAEDINCRCTLIGFFPEERSLMATETKATAVWKAREALRRPFEQRFIRALGSAFREQAEAALEALRRRA